MVRSRQSELSEDASAGSTGPQCDEREVNASQLLSEGMGLVAEGIKRAPYAFLIPDGQGDQTRVAQMVGRLWGSTLSHSRAKGTIKLKHGEYPAGTYAVCSRPAHRNYAVDLLTPQNYPKDGSEPYDDVSWELPRTLQIAGHSYPPIRPCARPGWPK